MVKCNAPIVALFPDQQDAAGCAVLFFKLLQSNCLAEIESVTLTKKWHPVAQWRKGDAQDLLSMAGEVDAFNQYQVCITLNECACTWQFTIEDAPCKLIYGEFDFEFFLDDGFDAIREEFTYREVQLASLFARKLTASHGVAKSLAPDPQQEWYVGSAAEVFLLEKILPERAHAHGRPQSPFASDAFLPWLKQVLHALPEKVTLAEGDVSAFMANATSALAQSGNTKELARKLGPARVASRWLRYPTPEPRMGAKECFAALFLLGFGILVFRLFYSP